MIMDLKDLFNEKSVSTLAEVMHQVHPDFARQPFIDAVFADNWPALELKQRMRHITILLAEQLPGDYRTALQILQQAIPMLPEQGFEKMVFPDFIEVYGLEDYQASVPALAYFTQFISAEFSVRHFIVKYPEKMMSQMLAWCHHEHPGVRRLASEGCRPRLPWGIALPSLKKDPSPILPILEELKLDPCESVRRSVANNLNDISKDNPQVTLEVLQNWQVLNEPEIDAITSHALRTLLKAGHPQALEMMGYPPPCIEVRQLQVSPTKIPLEGEATLSFQVVSLAEQTQDLMIDYVLHLVRARNKMGTKVFKLCKRTIAPGEVLQIERKVSFAPVTTRRYYPGTHAVEPQINGRTYGKVEFELLSN
jgi:3-methyladenine DNA glycosylase AlkC